ESTTLRTGMLISRARSRSAADDAAPSATISSDGRSSRRARVASSGEPAGLTPKPYASKGATISSPRVGSTARTTTGAGAVGTPPRPPDSSGPGILDSALVGPTGDWTTMFLFAPPPPRPGPRRAGDAGRGGVAPS